MSSVALLILLYVLFNLYIQYYLLPQKWNEVKSKALEQDINIETDSFKYHFPNKVIFQKMSVNWKDKLLYISDKSTVLLKSTAVDSIVIPMADISYRHGSTHLQMRAALIFKNKDKPELQVTTLNTKHIINMEYDKAKRSIHARGNIEDFIFPKADITLVKSLYDIKVSDIDLSSSIKANWAVDLNSLQIRYPLIANDIIETEDLKLSGPVHISYNNNYQINDITINNMSLILNDLKSQIDVRYKEGNLLLKATIPETKIQTIIDSIPEAIAGSIKQMKVEGDFKWSGSYNIPLNNISKMTVQSNPIVKDFRVLKIPDNIDVFKLNNSFTYDISSSSTKHHLSIPAYKDVSMEWMDKVSEHTRKQNQYWRDYAQKKASSKPQVIDKMISKTGIDDEYKFVRLEEMSEWIPKAVLTGEDGDFFFHNGINWLTLKQALEKNMEEGEVQLGASTITMQLIKNLFLTQERTISRKLQEAFLVYLVELQAGILKERILELYLNVVEFGPDIHGIYQASHHFFNKDPKDITIGEAVYLTSILPAPSSYYSIYESGQISSSWFKHMKYYFLVMLQRQRITQEQYDKAIEKPPLFYKDLDK